MTSKSVRIIFKRYPPPYHLRPGLHVRLGLHFHHQSEAVQKLRPQIEAYTAQVDEMNAEFDREFQQILNPVQRDKFATNQKKKAERDAKRLADRSPLSDEEIQRAKDRPLTSIYWYVVVTPHLEWMTKEYSLDAMQQTNVRALLALRRNKFIALVDSTAHPSIRLSRLAPLIERVAAPAK